MSAPRSWCCRSPSVKPPHPPGSTRSTEHQAPATRSPVHASTDRSRMTRRSRRRQGWRFDVIERPRQSGPSWRLVAWVGPGAVRRAHLMPLSRNTVRSRVHRYPGRPRHGVLLRVPTQHKRPERPTRGLMRNLTETLLSPS
jgi:hypothetical protein